MTSKLQHHCDEALDKHPHPPIHSKTLGLKQDKNDALVVAMPQSLDHINPRPNHRQIVDHGAPEWRGPNKTSYL